MKARDWLALAFSIAIMEAVGVLGAFFTAPAIGTWYATLAKPALMPPAWVFAPVWTLLYALMGAAAFLVWRERARAPLAGPALRVFLIQLFLNALWSILFFGLHAPLLAFADIVLLWLAILSTIARFARVSRAGAWLLAPYLLWASFALYLNLAIVVLNP